ncbi:cytochrome P450 714C2-like [Prunus avium]|uniref:Cytochrome P450 714C2-like n=1 Tax=Prunus avium TaxID=42229 RepID=A0A6P5SZN0_PRUAV|nr:cytochrome P450 714C2-like [Prunus avium]
MWRLEKEIHSMILRVATQLSTEAADEKDLLQTILKGAKNYGDADSLFSGISQEKFIVDNCMSIYLAGHETTAVTASWSLMLLAANPEWQACARAEVLGICTDHIPDAYMLRSMKTLNMVIQETLGLCPPSLIVVRQGLEDIDLNNIQIPKGTNIEIPIPILQQLPNIWGPDALDFNPNLRHLVCKSRPFSTRPVGIK